MRKIKKWLIISILLFLGTITVVADALFNTNYVFSSQVEDTPEVVVKNKVEIINLDNTLFINRGIRERLEDNVLMNGVEKYPAKVEDVEEIMYFFLESLETGGVDIEKLYGRKKLKVYILDTAMLETRAFAIHYDSENFGIYITSKLFSEWTKEELMEVLLHELGHTIDSCYFSDTLRGKYAEERDLENFSINMWVNSYMPWEQRFSEVFAEDFKVLFLPDDMYKTNITDYRVITDEEVIKLRQLVLQSIKRK